MASMDTTYQTHVKGRPGRELLCWLLLMDLITVLLIPIVMAVSFAPMLIFGVIVLIPLIGYFHGPVIIVPFLLSAFCAGMAKLIQFYGAGLTTLIWTILGAIAGLTGGIVGMKIAAPFVPVSLIPADPGLISRVVIFSALLSGPISAAVCQRFWPGSGKVA